MSLDTLIHYGGELHFEYSKLHSDWFTVRSQHLRKYFYTKIMIMKCISYYLDVKFTAKSVDIQHKIVLLLLRNWQKNNDMRHFSAHMNFCEMKTRITKAEPVSSTHYTLLLRANDFRDSGHWFMIEESRKLVVVPYLSSLCAVKQVNAQHAFSRFRNFRTTCEKKTAEEYYMNDFDCDLCISNVWNTKEKYSGWKKKNIAL